MYKAIRGATQVAAARGAIRIVHLSIQGTHLHLIVEAQDAGALADGMQSFGISAARRINRAAGRRGKVFGDRYHTHVLKTPREARRALSYVLNNFRKHGEALSHEWIDPYSSAIFYRDWSEGVRWEVPEDYEALVVSPAGSWILRNCGAISLLG